ncbi:OmpA family protein [uncultured Litoreibacter sp.]|uniref:OmpA family protein n=1 Tax=uncultured Litoreibacter sp. TaxID=1392394 RepID=UPI0034360687
MAGCDAPSIGTQITRSLQNSETGYFVNFDFASEILSHDAIEHLTRLSKLLTGPLSDLCVKLVGHTDTRGSNSYNQVLSEKRAERVWMFMVGPGLMQSGRIIAEGRGETEPLKRILGSDPKNRRVEILAKKTAIGTCH